jgi:hypothetical protein
MNVLLQKELYESLRIILYHCLDLKLVGVAVGAFRGWADGMWSIGNGHLC